MLTGAGESGSAWKEIGVNVLVPVSCLVQGWVHPPPPPVGPWQRADPSMASGWNGF